MQPGDSGDPLVQDVQVGEQGVLAFQIPKWKALGEMCVSLSFDQLLGVGEQETADR